MNAPRKMEPATRDGQADLRVLIAAPRGFCAGVDRAIRIVELAIERFGAPVYVRHEIVHNRYVVDSLKAKGAIFVDGSGAHTSERHSIMRNPYSLLCLTKKTNNTHE